MRPQRIRIRASLEAIFLTTFLDVSMVSVIVPTYNEEEILGETLAGLTGKLHGAELIIVDGQSLDRTPEIAARYGRVISAPTGRGTQMNEGARAAAGDVLLFLHADCRVEDGTMEAIEEALRQPDVVGGCLRQRIDAQGIGYRFLEQMIHLRARCARVMYGDQAVFVRRSSFFEVGGYLDIPLMEDVMFSKRLRRAGRTVVIGKTVVSSGRRWKRLGLVRTTLTNGYVRLLYAFGVSPEKLARIYYGNGNAKPS